jgi:hypothetical protein
MAIFGWKTMKQAALYTEAAEQKRLAGTAMSLISLDQTANESIPLSEAVERSGTKMCKKV